MSLYPEKPGSPEPPCGGAVLFLLWPHAGSWALPLAVALVTGLAPE